MDTHNNLHLVFVQSFIWHIYWHGGTCVLLAQNRWCGMVVCCLVADHVYVVLVLHSSLSVAVRGQMIVFLPLHTICTLTAVFK